MKSGIYHPKAANCAVRAFKTAFKGLPRVYLPFILPAVIIAPVWLSIPFAIWAASRLSRLAYITARAGVCAGVRACAWARARVCA